MDDYARFVLDRAKAGSRPAQNRERSQKRRKREARKPPEPGASHNRSTARAFRTNGFMEAGYELSRMRVLKIRL